MRWKNKIKASYEKSMNFKYEPLKAKEGLSFAVKEKRPNTMLKKVLIPTFCSLAGIGIALGTYFSIQGASANKDMVQDRSYNTFSKFDMTDDYSYAFCVEGETLNFQYHPKTNFLAIEFSDALNADNLTVKDEDEKLDFDSVNCGYVLVTKSSHKITWNYEGDGLSGEGTFNIDISKSDSVQKDRKYFC